MNKKIIYLDNVKNNLEFFKEKKKKLIVMVKADAYGHGIKNIVSVLKKEDVCLGVATLEEGQRLRKIWKKDILVAEPTKDVEHIACENFLFCVDDFETLKKCKRVGILNRCYLKIDVGMNRFGVPCENVKLLKKMARLLKKEEFKGLMTHFPSLSDEEQTKEHYKKFCKIRKWFKGSKACFGGSFVCNYDFEYDELRIGIGFYGYGHENLKPIMQVESEILKVIRLKKGEKLGYDGAFIADNDTDVGVVGIGYGDGVDRGLTNFDIRVNGVKCQIVGKICMDCMFVDLSRTTAEIVDILTDVEDMSKTLQTIPYEVLTRLTALRGSDIIKSCVEKESERIY